MVIVSPLRRSVYLLQKAPIFYTASMVHHSITEKAMNVFGAVQLISVFRDVVRVNDDIA